ncbi:hypothetical protein ACFLWN_01655 [Chloroflexota bacterium]
MRLENNRTAILIGLGFSACLTLIVLRGLFFSPGFLAYSDATFSHDMSWNRDMFTHTWSQFLGYDNSTRIMNLPFMMLLNYLFSDIGTFTKALYFFVYTLIGTIFFSVAFSWLRDIGTKVSLSYVGALVAALPYTYSSYTVLVSSHYGGLFSYALLPLTFYFARAAFRQHAYSVRILLKYGTILGLILMLATTMYYVFTLHLIVLVVTALGQIVPRLVTDVRQAKGYLLYGLCLSGLTVAMFALLWAWYIVPFLISHPMGLIELRHIIVDSDFVRIVAQNGRFFNVVRMLGFAGEEALFSSSGNFRTLWLVSTLAVPIIAITGIMLRPKSRDAMVLGILTIVGIFLAKGPNAPFGSQYLWFSSHFELFFATGGLYFPIRAIPLVILTYALLSSFTIAQILKLINVHVVSWRRPLSIALVVLICSFSVISVFPIVSGDNRGTMNPMLVSQPYNNVGSWFNRDGGNYRVAWLPPSDAAEWNPHGDSADEWQRVHVAYMTPLLSSKPITNLRGIGLPTKPVERGKLEQYIYYLLDKGKGGSIGKLLAMENAKYILYHDDILDREEFQELFTNLREIEDLTLVYNQDYIYVFENKDYLPYIQAKDEGILVVGGLRSLGLIAKTDIAVPDKRSFIFLEQSARNSEQMEETLKLTDTIIFYGNKYFDDFLLSSLDGKYYYPALDCWQNDYRSPWKRDFFYSENWQQRIRVNPMSNWDFDLNLGIMTTSESGVDLDFKVTTEEDSYEIWVRSLLSYDGGSLDAYIDGEKIKYINSYSSVSEEFKWHKLGLVDLSQGQHEIKLKTTNGFNAVNTIAVIPAKTFEQHREKFHDQIQSHSTKLIYAKNPYQMHDYVSSANVSISENPSDWKPDNGWAKKSLDTINFIEGNSSLKVEGSGATHGWQAVWYPDLVREYRTYDSLNLSLYFETIPEDLQYISVYILGNGIWMQWDVAKERLSAGQWRQFAFSPDNPDGIIPHGSPSDPPRLCIALTIPKGSEFSYNIDDVKLLRAPKIMEFSTIGEQKYSIAALAAPSEEHGSLFIDIDGTKSVFPVEREEWLYTAPVSFSEGNHQIIVSTQDAEIIQDMVIYPVNDNLQKLTDVLNTEVEASVLDYQVLSSTDIQVKVQVDGPFILSFGESYHSSWVATDDAGNKLPHVELNSVTNGFLVERLGTYQINIEFVLEKDFTIGKIVSGLTLVSVLTMLVFIYHRERKVKPNNFL